MEAVSKSVAILLLNLALFLPCLSTAVSPNQSFPPIMSKEPIHHHDYTRFADVERHCQSVLSSAMELRYDPNHAGDLKYKLSFTNGDWSQDAGQAPLLPFPGRHAAAAAAAAAAGHELLEAVPLASLMLLNIDTVPRHGARNALNVSGILSFTVTRRYPELELWPGVSRLLVQLQGVYTESKPPASGGAAAGSERVLCMVGDAVLPVRGSNGTTDPWDFAQKFHGGDGKLKPPVVADGNILVVLRYPMPAALTNRAVRGEMTSTSAAYFDAVRLVSQLGGRYDSGYQFQSQDAELELDAVTGCGGDPLSNDGGVMAPPNLDSRASVCDIVYQQQQYNPGSQVIMEVIPNWDCKGTDAFCSRVGPFETTRSATSSMNNMALGRSAIVVQSLQCKRWDSNVDGGTARVTAVLRYVPPWEDQPTAAQRTGLSGATVSAEGAWNASTGRACMVGCLGAGGEACRYRVTLSVQTKLSMARRGSIVGEIAAIDGSHPPLLFQQRVNPRSSGSSGRTPPSMSYVYTKVDQAMELLRRSGKTTGFHDGFVAKSLLSYPNIAAGNVDDMARLSNLGDNLNLRFQCMGRPPFVPEWVEDCCYELQVLCIGSLVGSYSAQFHGSSRSSMRTWIEVLRRARAVANQQVLNVSAEFAASRNDFLGPIPVMSVEGVYDPEDGRMHLIGCRSVHAPWRELAKRGDLEDGMDCDIEVTVEYPPTTTRWLPIRQTAKVTVASTREEDDPLRFARTELQSVPVVYREWQLDQLVRPILEGILCITVLSVARIVFVPVAFFG
ncbi:unnamed protein product [Urochloa humidicola]